MSKKFYLTTPIYYANDKPHLGHAYCTLAADVLARYHRLKGDKTFFLTGTDEHGAKIEDTAKKAGLEPKKFVDQIMSEFKSAWKLLNISYDNFIRTTDLAHKKAVQKALEYMYQKGDIYLGKYEGLYCPGCEQYKKEKDLVDGLCPFHKIKPEKISEECYNFRLSKYQDKLLKKIKKDELKILPIGRKKEIINFYEKEGLEDISFSRKNVKWGIPVPWDKTQIIYVWADAFLNYLTGLGWDGSAEKAPEIWPPDLQLMSKDILRVHATIWPAMLLSLDLPLPRQLFIHGFFLVEGQKMSKSLGNIISPKDLVKRYGVDGTRYLLLSAAPFGNDGDVSWQKFDEKYNADLANGLGNLVARVLTMMEKYEVKSQKARPGRSEGSSQKSKVKCQMLNVKCQMLNVKYEEAFENLQLYEALKIIWEFISCLDKYIDQEKPWVLAKAGSGLYLESNSRPSARAGGLTDISTPGSPRAPCPGSPGALAPGQFDKLEKVLYNLIQGLKEIAFLIQPFMPETAQRIQDGLKKEKGEILFPRIDIKNLNLKNPNVKAQIACPGAKR